MLVILNVKAPNRYKVAAAVAVNDEKLVFISKATLCVVATNWKLKLENKF